MLPRASGRYFNHASVKRNSLPDQASSRSAWFFFLGQVNCQFKHLLSQIGWKRSGRADGRFSGHDYSVTSAAIEADENKKHMGAIEYLGLQRPTQ